MSKSLPNCSSFSFDGLCERACLLPCDRQAGRGPVKRGLGEGVVEKGLGENEDGLMAHEEPLEDVRKSHVSDYVKYPV